MDEAVAQFEVTLHVSDRLDGGIRVLSDDVKGLFLGGSDRARVWSLVGPVLQHLLRSNHHLDVRQVIGPMTPPGAGEVSVEVEHHLAQRSAA